MENRKHTQTQTIIPIPTDGTNIKKKEVKIIFLDIDGVLNVIPQGHDEFGGIFHEHFVKNLQYIIAQTQAKIVISSSWRYSGLQEMKRMWKHRSLPGEVIDITCDCAQITNKGIVSHYDLVERGHEIQEWIDNHQTIIESYVILDDDNDMLQSQKDNFVRTANNKDHPDCIDIGYGLTKKCAEKAIEILNKNK